MSSTKFRIIHFNQPSTEELEPILKEFELGLKDRKIHETARLGLLGSESLIFREPFPKVESHDAYIYGVFATPTDIQDGQSDFFNLQFVAHESMAITVLWAPMHTSPERASSLFNRIRSPFPAGESFDAPGDVVVRLAHEIVNDLQDLISSLHESVQNEMDTVVSAISNRQYQSLSSKTSEMYGRVSRLKLEIQSIRSTIHETKNVLSALASGKVALRPPYITSNEEVPPFSAEQRIWIEDLHMRARSLKAQRDGLDAEVRLLYERLESLETRRQTSAQMRFAAVASILLLPALIVGFFGQNFNVNPWANSKWSWEISSSALILIALSQFIYFKRKKWF